MTATSPVATGTTSTAYRLDGLIATRTAGNGETATLTYDPVKRPINVAYATGGSLWQSYDRTGVTTEGRTLTGISANAGTGTQAFTYDALRRVTKATIPGTNTTCGQAGVACYGYDRNGNRTTKQVNATTTTTYHPTDEIETQTISGVIKSFTYNLYGSQTTAFDAANAVTTSAYDTAERLLTVTPPTGGAATYTYDALGRINTRTIGASVDTYSYLGSTETAWQIANAGGSGITTKSTLDATGARTAVTGNALTGYLGFDLHGNTVLAENGSKVITDALRYDAWGELIASTTFADLGAVLSRLRYCWYDGIALCCSHGWHEAKGHALLGRGGPARGPRAGGPNGYPRLRGR